MSIYGCVGELAPDIDFIDVGDPEELPGAPENEDILYASDSAPGDNARVCTTSNDGLRQRSGPGTGYAVVRVMPEDSTVKILERSGVWLKNDWGCLIGWSHTGYLCKVEGPVQQPEPTQPDGRDIGGGYTAVLSRDGVVALARSMTGFSYWWGGARFRAGGAAGACYGSCPSCSHSGSYGADCSGFVNKAWMVEDSMPMDQNKHGPASSYWYSAGNSIPRSSLAKADVLVRNGHMFLYVGGDPWGSLQVCEAKGCAYRTACNTRTASSSYRAIRRQGL
jgi:hypothetical protein